MMQLVVLNKVKPVERAVIVELVFAAVDEVNQQLRRAQRLEKTENTVISGEGGKLDSLGLVNLFFATEQKIEQKFEATVTLVDDVAMAGAQDPFRTLGSLIDFIQSLLEKKLNG
jgi:acyl carrier protein